jgi:hypothetical protein
LFLLVWFSVLERSGARARRDRDGPETPSAQAYAATFSLWFWFAAAPC